jgi:flagellar biosynthetic protein FliR
MLDQLLPNDLFSIALVFVRIGAAMMLLPGFGESYVAPRIRLLIALALALVVTPVVSASLPPMPGDTIHLLILIAGEVAVGLFFGALARILVSALHVAGVVIGFQTSLANAQIFDPINAQQGSLIGTFLNVVGVFMIFVTDLHHLMLIALADSYSVFVPGVAPPLGEMSRTAAEFVARSFLLGVQIAAPFIVVGLVFYIGLGLLARLMPQVQVFFIAIPLQIMLGFSVMAMTMSAGLYWFLTNFESGMIGFIGRG